jgi:hypothetical protein
MAASKMRHRKSTSERTASSAENSTSSVNLARELHGLAPQPRARLSGSMRSLCFIWMGLVAMNVCTRPELRP